MMALRNDALGNDGDEPLGTRDLLQTKHAILRSYPILAHLR